MAEPPEVAALREAVRVSPDNAPLRTHLAETLLKYGLASEAEAEYRTALKARPHDGALKVGLARCYDRQGKTSHALVILEELVKRPDTPAAAYLLHSRILLKGGDVSFAVAQYRAAVEDDPDLRDADLEARLGIDAGDDGEVSDGRLRAGWGGDADDAAGDVTVERPRITFADVGGMASVKDEVRMKVIHPLEHAELFAAYGKAVGGGVLMYGPPGCGKTHLARATAGEISAGFVSVGISDVLEMWIGNSERNLHGVFDRARRTTPCVLFFDEVDALGASRSDMKAGAGRHLINQFLSEMDGVDASNDGVMILAATNAPWHLDPAFRRPGRFDRILFVPPPDREARSEILRILLTGKPSADVDFDHVAKKTDRFSGADLKSVVDTAVEAKLTEAMKTGRPEPLTTRDLATAAKRVRPSTAEWFATAKNYALYANEAGLYDEILEYLGVRR